MVGRPQKHLAILEPPVRQLCAYSVIALFVVFFFSSGLSYHFQDHLTLVDNKIKFPDFGNYQDVRTLQPEYFPLDDPNRRTIIVGDIHGMYKSLNKLLKKISYNSSQDSLIHVGDILTKGTHNGSMEVLVFMATHNITGVRGNHDQKVIEWRSWIKWIRSQPGGPRWLKEVSASWATASAKDNPDPDSWLAYEKRKDKDGKWWRKIPEGWQLFGAHFTVAQDMSQEQWEYLRTLPSVVHVPSAHAFLVHGGILPSDPTLAHNDPRQPLAHIPRLPKGSNNNKDKMNSTLHMRMLQERAILIEVPQNDVPFNVLNIRSVMNGKVTKESDNGKPWSKMWKHDMFRCAGFEKDIAITEPTKEHLPCYPSTVIYGHAAGRGLDVKRWSIGLDSGCVYERRLSALVLGPDLKKAVTARGGDVDIDRDRDVSEEGTGQGGVRFGETHWGKIVSVSCP